MHISRRLRLLSGFLLLCTVFLCSCAGPLRIGSEGLGIHLSQEDLQKEVNKKTGFPWEKSLAGIASVRIDPAQVKLYASENAIGLNLPASIKVGFVTLHGHALVSSAPEYDTSDGSIYLSHLTLRELQVPGLSSTTADLVSSATTEILTLSVKRYRIYTLNQKHFKERVARLLLKDVKVKDDGLFLKLGL